jgi:prophage DNA circulation protein
MDLLTGELNGILLELDPALHDRFTPSIARYEYPNADGADLDNLGQNARTTRVKALFWDDGGKHLTYDTHRELLLAIDIRTLKDFIHPKYGKLKGEIENIDVSFDDRKRCASVEFDFVEQMRGTVEAVPIVDVQAAVEQAFIDGQAEAQALFEADAVTELGPEAPALLAQNLDPERSLLEQFSGLSKVAMGYVARVNSLEQQLNATLNAVANPANSLLSTIKFATNLPGRILGSVARCVERYARLYDGLKSAPAAFLRSLQSGMLTLEASVGFGPTIRIAAAHRVGLECANLYDVDQKNRQLLTRQEQTATFDKLGNYAEPDQVATIMTIQEIEATLAITRQLLQDAVTRDREAQAPKSMARKLLEHADQVKLEREKLITITLDNPLPLHLLCQMRGLSASYAPRILAVNPQITNPNAVSGEVTVYAR